MIDGANARRGRWAAIPTDGRTDGRALCKKWLWAAILVRDMDTFGDLDIDLGVPGDTGRAGRNIDYEDDKNKAVEFLEKYITSDTHIHKYMNYLQEVADRRRKRIVVSLDDVMTYTGDADFVDNIQRNTYRYLEVFKTAIDELMVGMEPSDGVHIVEDVFDTLQATRVQAELNGQQANSLEGGNGGNGQNRRPAFPQS